MIPRLVLARQQAGEPAAASAEPPSAADIRKLAGIVMRGDLAAAAGVLDAALARGLPLELIYLELLAPVARHLGDLWTDDRADFASVTIGLCCLQQLVLERSPAFGPRPGRPSGQRRILLAPTPGEQHSFGLLMVGEFFRRQGWETHSATGASAGEIVAMVRTQSISMVGFSLSCETRLERLAGLIHDIRRATCNPALGILVGGQLFTQQPDLAVLVGADATATDGQQAVLKAEALLALLACEE